MEAAIKLMKMSESEWGSVGGGVGRCGGPPKRRSGPCKRQNMSKQAAALFGFWHHYQLPSASARAAPGPSTAGVIFPWCSAATSCSCSLCLLLLFSPPFCFLFVLSSSCWAFGVFAYFAFELHYLPFYFRFIVHLNGKEWYNVIQDNLFIYYRFFCVLLVLEIFGIPDPNRPLRRISRPKLGIFGSV